jgi:DNA-directed RNA polymerase subunit M/transcription elongation factor TFIIS
MSKGNVGAGGGVMSVPLQRQRLEQICTAEVCKALRLTGLNMETVATSSKAPPPPSPSLGSSKKKTIPSPIDELRYALRKFYDRVPYTQGAQLVFDDFFSFLRSKQKLYSNNNNNINNHILGEVVRYLESPPFVRHLAEFGKLPDQPYILVFDPYAYQSHVPPTEEESKAIDPSAFSGENTNLLMPSKNENIEQDKMLVNIFEEELSSNGFKCPKCKETRFVKYREVQRRSADEGSSFHCSCNNCHHSWMYR